MKINTPTVALVALTFAAALAGCNTMTGMPVRTTTAATVCQDETVEIYFDSDSAEVTPAGLALLQEVGKVAKGCRVDGVEVLGLADATGAPDANLKLSRSRAESVTTALVAAGLPAAEFRVAAAGQAGSIAPGGEVRPLRRRADVTVRLAPK
jgi:outer membrane protein OmpA-like peptidoglycan-associated protein